MLTQTEAEAVRVSGLSPPEIADRLLSEEGRFSVAQQVLSGAQTAATEEKRLFLGRLLAAGASAPEIDVDGMLVYSQILVELEAPHLEVLKLLERATRAEIAIEPTGGLPISRIVENCPGVWLYSHALMTRLHGHGLVEDAAHGLYGGPDAPTLSWKLSEFGTNFMGMLRRPFCSNVAQDEPDETAGESLL